MSKPLDLPDPLYDALAQAAAASGTTPVGWIAANLPAWAPNGGSLQGTTLADLFAGRTGRIAGGAEAALAEKAADVFAQDLERKRREGRL